MKKFNSYYIILVPLVLVFVSVVYLINNLSKNEFENIIISGSSSGILIIQPIIDDFIKEHPFIKVQALSGSSTSEGVKSLSKGIINLAVLARYMNDSEKLNYPDLEYVPVFDDFMVLGVNLSVTEDNLSSLDIIKIFTGEITNWNQLGENDGEIVVLDREETESTKILLREKIIGNVSITPKAIELHSSSSTNEAIQNTPFTIGQTSLGIINYNNLKIKPLLIDGYYPTKENAINGKYNLMRNYGLAYSKSNSNVNVLRLIDYLKEHLNTLEQYGYIIK